MSSPTGSRYSGVSGAEASRSRSTRCSTSLDAVSTCAWLPSAKSWSSPATQNTGTTAWPRLTVASRARATVVRALWSVKSGPVNRPGCWPVVTQSAPSKRRSRLAWAAPCARNAGRRPGARRMARAAASRPGSAGSQPPMGVGSNSRLAGGALTGPGGRGSRAVSSPRGTVVRAGSGGRAREGMSEVTDSGPAHSAGLLGCRARRLHPGRTQCSCRWPATRPVAGRTLRWSRAGRWGGGPPPVRPGAALRAGARLPAARAPRGRSGRPETEPRGPRGSTPGEPGRRSRHRRPSGLRPPPVPPPPRAGPSRIEAAQPVHRGHPLHREHVRRDPHVDAVTLRHRQHIEEGTLEDLLEPLVHGRLVPEVRGPVLHPLEVADRYPARVGQDIRNDEHALLLEDFVGAGRGGSVGPLADHLGFDVPAGLPGDRFLHCCGA